MSVARGFGLNGKSIYMNICKPQIVECNFVVDLTNGNGLGLRSLKSNGYIQNVFMQSNPAATTTFSVFSTGQTLITLANLTNIVVGEVVTDSTTGGNIAGGTTVLAVYPATNQILLSAATLGNSAASPGDTLSFAMVPALVGNPMINGVPGYWMVQFKNNFNAYLGGFTGFVSPSTGGPIVITAAGAHLVKGTPYIIASVGTSTAADWAAVGLPGGYAPQVGMTFVATATGAGVGSGTVVVSGVSGITTVEAIGNPSLQLNSSNLATYNGAYLIGQFLGATAAGNTALIPTAPANGSVVAFSFWFDGSSVTVDGL